jgi:hypothetical protein
MIGEELLGREAGAGAAVGGEDAAGGSVGLRLWAGADGAGAGEAAGFCSGDGLPKFSMVMRGWSESLGVAGKDEGEEGLDTPLEYSASSLCGPAASSAPGPAKRRPAASGASKNSRGRLVIWSTSLERIVIAKLAQARPSPDTLAPDPAAYQASASS